MKLLVDNGLLYANNVLCCRAEVKDGNPDQPGRSAITPQFSHHHHGRDLLLVDGLGWLGADDACAIVVGRVVDGTGALLPCRIAETRLMNLINAVTDRGETATLEIKP